MAAFKILGRKIRRKYPIKRDEYGMSARSRCFEMFADKTPLDEISNIVGVKIDTARRYHLQWKKHPNFERKYAFVQSLFKKTAPERERNIELFAEAYGISKEQFETILYQPHGLRRLMTGKFYFPAHAEADHKRYVALEVALLIADHFINNGGKFEDVYYAFRRWMQENMKSREEEDADIKDDNKRINFIHGMLAAAAKQEQEGRAKPDTLSEEERNAILKYWVRGS